MVLADMMAQMFLTIAQNHYNKLSLIYKIV
nr:MAG TPA: hypothetical protein [Bacteriophage sp.]